MSNVCLPSETLDFRRWTLDLEAMKGVEPLSTGLQDRRSVFQLSYIAIGVASLES